jgi:hypothetical protein
MNQRGNQDWLKKAGAIIEERPETPSEVATQHPHAL